MRWYWEFNGQGSSVTYVFCELNSMVAVIGAACSVVAFCIVVNAMNARLTTSCCYVR